MICVKLTCSCIIAFLHDGKVWDDLNMWLLFFLLFFSTFPNTKCNTIHPPRWLQHSTSTAPRQTSPGPAAPTPSCSPRWASCGARGPAAAPGPPGLGAAAARPPPRRHGPPARTRASAVDRHGSRQVSTAPWREGAFFHYLWCRGIFLDPSPWWENEIPGFELFWFHLSSCYRLYFLMLFELVVNTVAYCNLQLSLLRLCGISGCKSLVTRQYSSWLNNRCLLMCWPLWGDWGPHRPSAWSAKRSSGPNLFAVASARHRSLGPWWCLSHGRAYHMAMRWPTMSPTWKTNQVQENGQRYAKSSRCGTAPGFGQKLATGLQSMVPALRDLQPYVFTFVLNGAGNSSQLIA